MPTNVPPILDRYNIPAYMLNDQCIYVLHTTVYCNDAAALMPIQYRRLYFAYKLLSF